MAGRRWTASVSAILAVLALGLAVGVGPGPDRRFLPEALAVTATPLPHFRRGDAAARRFGRLDYVGGLELASRHHGFGGLSAIRMAKDGERFLAVTDVGDWMSGRIEARDGAPVAVAEASIAPLLVTGGGRAKDVGLWDAESIAIDGDVAFVGVERDHAILVYDFGRDGLRARGKRLPLPLFVADWPENRGIEALGILPAPSPYAGRLIAISERSGGREDATEGFVMRRDGGEAFRFRLVRRDGFDITDLDFLPGGDLVVLERYFLPLRGVAMRLRRIRLADVAPDAALDGEVLLTADGGAFHVDNMEGLSIHGGPDGATYFTIVSDDNFSIAQRTLLLRFRWSGD